MNFKEKDKEKRTEITERDREIMKWILEQKFMTERQIRRDTVKCCGQSQRKNKKFFKRSILNDL